MTSIYSPAIVAQKDKGFCMHALAQHANESLPSRILRLLSEHGRQMYFPSAGILGQAAEAKGRTINGTIGIALQEDGSPLHLPGLDQWVQLPPQDAYPYTSSYGKPALRDRWRDLLLEKKSQSREQAHQPAGGDPSADPWFEHGRRPVSGPRRQAHSSRSLLGELSPDL